jgi:hypothetical protein
MAPSMILSSACCTLSPDVLRGWPSTAFSLSISSMKTMPCRARSTSPSVRSTSRCRMASISSLTNRLCASAVASAVTNGTPRARDSVSHISVLPVPVGPIRRMLLLMIGASSARGSPIFLKCA